MVYQVFDLVRAWNRVEYRATYRGVGGAQKYAAVTCPRDQQGVSRREKRSIHNQVDTLACSHEIRAFRFVPPPYRVHKDSTGVYYGISVHVQFLTGFQVACNDSSHPSVRLDEVHNAGVVDHYGTVASRGAGQSQG